MISVVFGCFCLFLCIFECFWELLDVFCCFGVFLGVLGCFGGFRCFWMFWLSRVTSGKVKSGQGSEGQVKTCQAMSG